MPMWSGHPIGRVAPLPFVPIAARCQPFLMNALMRFMWKSCARLCRSLFSSLQFFCSSSPQLTRAVGSSSSSKHFVKYDSLRWSHRLNAPSIFVNIIFTYMCVAPPRGCHERSTRPTYAPTCLSTYIFTCLLTHPPIHISTYLPAYLPSILYEPGSA